MECVTTVWSVVVEIADFSADVLVLTRVAHDVSLDVEYTVCSLGILTVVVTFDMFLLSRRCTILSKLKDDHLVPVGWIGSCGNALRRATRGYENQLLTVYTSILEDIPSVTLTSCIILNKKVDNIILLTCGVSILCLGQKLAAIEKVFMWKSIGTGQHMIQREIGRRARQQSLYTFLEKVEEGRKRILLGSCDMASNPENSDHSQRELANPAESAAFRARIPLKNLAEVQQSPDKTTSTYIDDTNCSKICNSPGENILSLITGDIRNSKSHIRNTPREEGQQSLCGVVMKQDAFALPCQPK